MCLSPGAVNRTLVQYEVQPLWGKGTSTFVFLCLFFLFLPEAEQLLGVVVALNQLPPLLPFRIQDVFERPHLLFLKIMHETVSFIVTFDNPFRL